MKHGIGCHSFKNQLQGGNMKRLIPLIMLLFVLNGCVEASITLASIEFVSNGGSEVSTIYLEHNTTTLAPEDPVKEGYVFSGWYTEESFENLYDFRSPITDNVVLYAKWDEI